MDRYYDWFLILLVPQLMPEVGQGVCVGVKLIGKF